MPKMLIEIDTDTQAVVPKEPNDKLRNVLLEWCSTVEGAWFDILAASTSTQPEQAQPAPIPTSERLPTEAKFEIEWRYIVIKRKKLLEYSLGDSLTAEKIEKRILDQIPDEALVECVVIESDWPEYEQVWKMLEARCTGLTRPAEPGGE